MKITQQDKKIHGIQFSSRHKLVKFTELNTCNFDFDFNFLSLG